MQGLWMNSLSLITTAIGPGLVREKLPPGRPEVLWQGHEESHHEGREDQVVNLRCECLQERREDDHPWDGEPGIAEGGMHSEQHREQSTGQDLGHNGSKGPFHCLLRTWRMQDQMKGEIV